MKKTKKQTLNTNSFSIARYILLFLVIIGCVALVTWTLIHTSHKMQENKTAQPTIHTPHPDPCTQDIRNIVSQAWAYAPDTIPARYVNMAHEYMNGRVDTRIRGTCNNVHFTCRPGQIRRDCNPCAASDAQQFAIDAQVSDLTRQHCRNINNK